MGTPEKELNSINTLIQATVSRLYRESQYSPRPQKQVEHEQKIIETRYGPYGAFRDAIYSHIEDYLLPLIDLVLEEVSEIRIENRIPYVVEDNDLLNTLKEIVMSEWRNAVLNAYAVSIEHVIHNVGRLAEYKDKELIKARDRSLGQEPSALLGIVSEKFLIAAESANLKIRRINQIDAQNQSNKGKEIYQVGTYIEGPYIEQQIKSQTKEYKYMEGDQITVNGSNNTIVNRSTVQNAFNKVKTEFDDETANALKRIEEEINKSGNKEAAENFEAFTEELAKPEPKKSLLKTLWQGTLDALPTLAQLSGIVSLIIKLFN